MMNLKKSELKSYAILLPLLRENEVIIASLFDSMSKILYPKNLFDIFVLCEYEDQETINIVKEYIDTKLDMRYSNSGVIKVKQKFDIFYLNNKRILFNIAYNI